jgi:hypothetical protein
MFKWISDHKAFVIGILSIILMVINAATQQSMIPLKYISYAGLAATAITAVIQLLQNTALKGENARLRARLRK